MRKDVYPYHYIDDSEKEDFYSQLNIQGITNEDYAHVKRTCKDFEIRNLGDYHDLYVQIINFCELMYLKAFETFVLKYIS